MHENFKTKQIDFIAGVSSQRMTKQKKKHNTKIPPNDLYLGDVYVHSVDFVVNAVFWHLRSKQSSFITLESSEFKSGTL